MKGPISKAIEKAVLESGMLQKDIASKAKISPPQLTRMMNGERQLNLPAFDRLCKVLGLELRKRDS